MVLIRTQNSDNMILASHEKTDGRKFTTGNSAANSIYSKAIKLQKSGKTYIEIAKILDIHYTAVIKWWNFYEKKGYDGLLIRKRGVHPWINSKLKPEQMEMLKTTLLESIPDQLGLNFSLWTRQAIQNLIINFWDISISLVTVGRYMKKLEFTPQKTD